MNHEKERQDSGLTPRRRIIEELRRVIESGERAPGQKLPSSRELMRQYKTSRKTADEALKTLQNEGLIDVHHGKSPTVRQRHPLMRLGGNRYSQRLREETGLSPFLLEAARQGWQAHVEGRSVKRVQPPPNVAERLGVSPNRKSVIRRENHYFADDATVQIGVTYIPWDIAKGTPLTKVGEPIPTGIYAYLETLGYTVRTIREEASARLPRHDEPLMVPPGVPVIELLHTSINDDGTPFDVTCFIIRADMMGLDYTMPVNTPRHELTIRERQAADIYELMPLLVRVHRTDGYPVEGVEDPRAWLEPSNLVKAWVAVTDRVVGHALITGAVGERAADLLAHERGVKPENISVLGRLFVDPAERSKGTAQRLAHACAQYAARHQLTLVGEVLTKDTVAINLYERMGLQHLGTIEHTLSDGTSFPALVYTSPDTDPTDTSTAQTYIPEEASKPERQPVVAAIVVSPHGTLIGKRRDGKPPWTFIAGEIEPGESAADAVVREVKEETGLMVHASKHEIGRRVHPKTGRTMIYLACKPVGKTDIFVGDEDELLEVRWASLAEVDELMPELFAPVRLHLTNQLGQEP